jgi:LPXTG-motif cell wall-anchored protein
MIMDDFDMEDVDLEMEEEELPEEGNNRTFLLVAGILGAVLLLSLICIAVYAMVYVPRSRSQRETQVAEINAQNTEVAAISAMTIEAQQWTATPSITPEPNTPTVTNTPVVAPSETPALDQPTVDPRTATVAALLTQQAPGFTPGAATPTVTELPDTGFVDDVGIPGMLGMALALIVVVFLARRIRTAE